jgi:hypothetical protein
MGPALIPAPAATQQLVGDYAQFASDLTKTALDGIILQGQIGKAAATTDGLAEKTFSAVTGDVSRVLQDLKILGQDIMAFFSPLPPATRQPTPQPTRQPQPPMPQPDPGADSAAAILPPSPDVFTPPHAHGVHALFDINTRASSPFPSNHFTVHDDTQNTGRRVNLPLPDPSTNPSDYQDTQVLNTLDGFNLQPRLSIPFDGAIDPNTVNSNTVFLISLGDTLDPHDRGGQVVGINQVVWDPATKTLHVESDQLLDQHTRYALIVTNGIHDADGNPVQASDAFRHFREELKGDDKHDLLDAVKAAREAGVPEKDIVTASVFTTESATTVLEKIRDQIHAATPDPADFNLGPDGARTVFSFDKVKGITWNQQTRDDSNVLNPVNLDLSLLRDIYPGAVGGLAFGKYVSPDYEVHPGEYIPPVGTRTGTPVVQGTNDIYFNLVLPSGPKPEGGWPVAIFGHGGNGNKNEAMTWVAASLAHQGIATIIINGVGNGLGPLGTLTVNQTDGESVTFLAGGRAIKQNANHVFGTAEGFSATVDPNTGRDWTLITGRDGIRQTAADLMQLVREIEVGMHVNGDRSFDLDPSRIYYFGWSQGASYGTPFLAVEPDVKVGVLNSPGHGFIDKDGRLAPRNRPDIGTALAARIPSLLNSPGLDSIGGVPVGKPYFNENMPLRNQPPVINTVAGAMAIQEFFDNGLWASQAGNAVAYAPHLRKDPLAGVPAKSVIVQFAKADQSAANPNITAVIRAGDLADVATFYRHDLAYAEDPSVPNNQQYPHQFMVNIFSTNHLVTRIALGAQRQIAEFFASDGQVSDDLSDVTTSDGKPLFEVPIRGPLPEDLNFIT